MDQPEKPHYLEHRKRLRERFRQAGAAGFQPYELLEFLLTYGIPRKDVKPLAKELIDRFGSLAAVLDAPAEDLEAFPGMGPVSTALLKLVKDLGGVYLAEGLARKEVLSSPRAVVDFARMTLAGLAHEAVMVIYLDNKNRVMAHDIAQEGTVNRAVVYPRRIIEAALRHHASGLILIHNHPSGLPHPSEEDRQITRAIAEAARTLDIRVLDHIVVGKVGYVSFTEEGLMP
jgi:DNA repair protein RadC